MVWTDAWTRASCFTREPALSDRGLYDFSWGQIGSGGDQNRTSGRIRPCGHVIPAIPKVSFFFFFYTSSFLTNHYPRGLEPMVDKRKGAMEGL